MNPLIALNPHIHCYFAIQFPFNYTFEKKINSGIMEPHIESNESAGTIRSNQTIILIKLHQPARDMIATMDASNVEIKPDYKNRMKLHTVGYSQ